MCMGPSLCKNCWNFVKIYPASLLEIWLVGFVDTQFYLYDDWSDFKVIKYLDLISGVLN